MGHSISNQHNNILTLWIWMKLGSCIVSIETLTYNDHTLYGFQVTAKQRVVSVHLPLLINYNFAQDHLYQLTVLCLVKFPFM